MKLNAAVTIWKVGQKELKCEKEENKLLKRKIWQCKEKLRKLKEGLGIDKKETGLESFQDARVSIYR